MEHDHTLQVSESAVVLQRISQLRGSSSSNLVPFQCNQQKHREKNNQQRTCETMILEGCEKAAHMGNNYS